MRIRASRSSANYGGYGLGFGRTTLLRNLPDARPLETYSPVVEGVNVLLWVLGFGMLKGKKAVLDEGTALPAGIRTHTKQTCIK